MSTLVDFRSHTDTRKLLLFRLWIPFLLLLGPIMILRDANHASVIEIPFVFWAVFNLSAARVRPGDKILRYRRFFSWQEVSYGEILECKVSIAPGMGVLKLRHSSFPWGSIYFVREEPHQWLSPGGQSQLTRFINARREGRPNLTEAAPIDHADAPSKRDGMACGVAAVVGVLLALLSRTLLPDISLQLDPGRYPYWIAAFEHFQEAIASWPWNLVAGFVLLAIVVVLRFRKAWGFAFAFGGVLGSFVVKMIG